MKFLIRPNVLRLILIILLPSVFYPISEYFPQQKDSGYFKAGKESVIIIKKDTLRPAVHQLQEIEVSAQQLDSLTQTEKKLAAQAEEIYLTFKYENVVNTVITALYKNDTVYIPFGEIFSYLHVKYNSDYQNRRIKGYFLNKDAVYNFNFAERSFLMNESGFYFSGREYIYKDLEYYVTPEILNKAFSFTFTVDISRLTLTLKFPKPLPVYAEYLREQNHQKFLAANSQKDSNIVSFNRERSWLNGGIIDYNLNSTYSHNFSPIYNYNFGIGGELFGGETQVNFIGNYSDGKNLMLEDNYKWRYAFDNNKYISRISLGNLFSNGAIPLAYEGLEISNEPLEPRKNFDIVPYADKTNSNWMVELYLNDRLTDFVQADQNGAFRFDIPAAYGASFIRMQYYGPDGDFYVRNLALHIPYDLLPAKEFNYSVNAGRMQFNKNKMAQASGSYGLNKWSSVKLGVDYFDDDKYNKPIFYNSFSARLGTNYFVNLMAASHALYKISANALYSNNASADISYMRREPNPVLNVSGVKNQGDASLFLPMPFSAEYANLQSSVSYVDYSSGANRTDYRLGINANISQFSPSLSFYANRWESGRYVESYNALNAACLIYVDRGNVLSFLRGKLLSLRINYNLDDKQFDNFNASFSSNIFDGGRLRFYYYNNFQNNISSFQLQFTFDFSSFRYMGGITDHTADHMIQGSIIYNSADHDFYFSSKSGLGKSIASVKTFMDDNGDGKLNGKEEIVDDASVWLESAANISRGSNGEINIMDIVPYMEYEANINASRSKNPLLNPYYKNFYFTAGANSVKNIYIPFYNSGEIGGSVNIEGENGGIAMPGLKLYITGMNNSFYMVLKTFNDGSFYYLGVPPGEYKISVDAEQLKSLSCSPEGAERTFTVVKTGENPYIEINFNLHQEKVQSALE